MKAIAKQLAVKLLALCVAIGCAGTAEGTLVTAGPVSDLGTSFLINTASTGGGDTNPGLTSWTLDRDFTLNVGPNGSLVNVTGIGWAMGASQVVPGNFVDNMSVTITYLGQNGVVGGTGLDSDVVIGTDSNLDLTYLTTPGSTYRGVFDTPFTQLINGLSNKFRITLTSPTGLRFKTTTGTAISAMKISIAGTSVAVPEPGAFLFGGLATLGVGFSSRLYRGARRRS